MEDKINLKELRAAIPVHCFVPNYQRSLSYLFRDIGLSIFLCFLASCLIPQIPHQTIRIVAWVIYGWLQGLVFTGLWVLGHECGHDAFSRSTLLNSCIGFSIHSALLTPYFSWRLTHRRHHRYTGHIEKDNSHVPSRRMESTPPSQEGFIQNLEDSPVYLLVSLTLQQFLGWPLYLFASVTSGCDGAAQRRDGKMAESCHFNPYAALFRGTEFWPIILSDIGITLTTLCLVYIGKAFGATDLFLLYGQPFLWLNQWIVAVTYLQHTHPEVPRYEPDAWTFVKGALSTIDRDSGAVGRFFLHNVMDYHVVHHLFPSIPFYHAPEATKAIRQKLGKNYLVDRQNLLWALWKTYSNCRWVTPMKSEFSHKQDGTLYFGNWRTLRTSN